jgi:hypothetical protein
MGEIVLVNAIRSLVIAAILSAASMSPTAAAVAKAHDDDSPLTLPLVLIAIGAAVIIAAVAVYRLWRSSYQGKPKYPTRD